MGKFNRMCRDHLQKSLASDATLDRPRISTRRQRRAYGASSDNYSDFCDTDLSRRIEAMVVEVEAAYENRHVTKSKHVIDQHVVRTEPTCRKSLGPKRTKNASPSPQMNRLSQNMTSESVESRPPSATGKNTSFPMSLRKQQKTMNSIKDRPGFQLLRRALQSIQESDDDVPAMKPCDSLASLSSNHSISTRSSSGFLNALPPKKTWASPPPRGNADWAIME